MTNFEDREKGFERKFAHDEELKFRATARRNKLLGMWAAAEMGITGDAAQGYAREVIKADLERARRFQCLRRLRHWLSVIVRSQLPKRASPRKPLRLR